MPDSEPRARAGKLPAGAEAGALLAVRAGSSDDEERDLAMSDADETARDRRIVDITGSEDMVGSSAYVFGMSQRDVELAVESAEETTSAPGEKADSEPGPELRLEVSGGGPVESGEFAAPISSTVREGWGGLVGS